MMPYQLEHDYQDTQLSAYEEKLLNEAISRFFTGCDPVTLSNLIQNNWLTVPIELISTIIEFTNFTVISFEKALALITDFSQRYGPKFADELCRRLAEQVWSDELIQQLFDQLKQFNHLKETGFLDEAKYAQKYQFLYLFDNLSKVSKQLIQQKIQARRDVTQNIDLSDRSYCWFNFKDLDLRDVRFDECNLSGSGLSHQQLERTSFTGSNLRNADLSWAHFDKKNVQGTFLQHVNNGSLRSFHYQGDNMWATFREACDDISTGCHEAIESHSRFPKDYNLGAEIFAEHYDLRFMDLVRSQYGNSIVDNIDKLFEWINTEYRKHSYDFLDVCAMSILTLIVQCYSDTCKQSVTWEAASQSVWQRTSQIDKAAGLCEEKRGRTQLMSSSHSQREELSIIYSYLRPDYLEGFLQSGNVGQNPASVFIEFCNRYVGLNPLIHWGLSHRKTIRFVKKQIQQNWTMEQCIVYGLGKILEKYLNKKGTNPELINDHVQDYQFFFKNGDILNPQGTLMQGLIFLVQHYRCFNHSNCRTIARGLAELNIFIQIKRIWELIIRQEKEGESYEYNPKLDPFFGSDQIDHVASASSSSAAAATCAADVCSASEDDAKCSVPETSAAASSVSLHPGFFSTTSLRTTTTTAADPEIDSSNTSVTTAAGSGTDADGRGNTLSAEQPILPSKVMR